MSEGYRSFAERMDDETLLYASAKLSKIRPEASLNREEGATEWRAPSGVESASPGAGASGAAPRAEHCIGVGEGRNHALEGWRRHTCGSIYGLSGQVCQMPRGHGGLHTAYRSSWDDEHAAGNRYRPAVNLP